MTNVAPPPTCRTFTIPLGIMDVDVIVQSDGDVHIKSEAPIPQALHEAVSAVAGTWAIDLAPGATLGTTLIGPRGWRELFAHRAREVACE